MKEQELEKEIAKKVDEIRQLYYSAYPNGDYLTIAFFKDSIHFNNRHWSYDSEFPIDYFEGEGAYDDNEDL